jgi:hypothetical protein
VDLDGLVVRVSSLDDLIRMKRAASRPQDRIAVEWLSALRDELEPETPPGTRRRLRIGYTARVTRRCEHASMSTW